MSHAKRSIAAYCRRLPVAIVLLEFLLISGCSTSFWYTSVQNAAYLKCEQLPNLDDRNRCKSENYPDEGKYNKERAATNADSNRSK